MIVLGELQLDPDRGLLQRGDRSARVRFQVAGLAAALMQAGRPMPARALVDTLYGNDPDDAPAYAVECVRLAIHQLRIVLRGLDAAIVTLPRFGYELVVL